MQLLCHVTLDTHVTFHYRHCEMNVPVSTRLDESIFKRIEQIAEKDHRSIANVIEICILGHLPEMEREIMGEDFARKQTKARQAA